MLCYVMLCFVFYPCVFLVILLAHWSTLVLVNSAINKIAIVTSISCWWFRNHVLIKTLAISEFKRPAINR